MLSDEELLDFDESRLAHFDRSDAKRALDEHGDAFRYQLVAARHIERWANSLERSSRAPGRNAETDAAYVQALREVIAHLRQGDYLPGGTLYEDTLKHPD